MVCNVCQNRSFISRRIFNRAKYKINVRFIIHSILVQKFNCLKLLDSNVGWLLFISNGRTRRRKGDAMLKGWRKNADCRPALQRFFHGRSPGRPVSSASCHKCAQTLHDTWALKCPSRGEFRPKMTSNRWYGPSVTETSAACDTCSRLSHWTWTDAMRKVWPLCTRRPYAGSVRLLNFFCGIMQRSTREITRDSLRWITLFLGDITIAQSIWSIVGLKSLTYRTGFRFRWPDFRQPVIPYRPL